MPPKGKPGTKGGKQIAEENKSTLAFYSYVILGVNLVYFILQYCLFWESFTSLCMVLSVMALIVYSASYQFMAYMAKATYGPNGNLLDPGVDLNMEAGMAEYVKDAILLTSIVQTLTLISSYFWLLWLMGPVYGFYLLWVTVIAPWIFAEPPPEMDEKKQKKMERKMMRRH